MAYAASFGTNKWEYNSLLTCQCKKLVSRFDKVSVRENSGIELCRQYLDVDARICSKIAYLNTKLRELKKGFAIIDDNKINFKK